MILRLLKMRIPGLGGKVVARTGGTIVLTPGGVLFFDCRSLYSSVFLSRMLLSMPCTASNEIKAMTAPPKNGIR